MDPMIRPHEDIIVILKERHVLPTFSGHSDRNAFFFFIRPILSGKATTTTTGTKRPSNFTVRYLQFPLYITMA